MTDQLDTEARRLDRQLADEQARITLSRERFRQFRSLPQGEQDEIRAAYASVVHACRRRETPPPGLVVLAARWPT